MGKSGKNENKSKKKHKHKERKEKKKKSKKLKKEKNKEKVNTKKDEKKAVTAETNIAKEAETRETNDDDFAIPLELMNSKSHAPETPEEYERRQKRIRREIDPVTGRSRLIKGDGEILEEIVSKEQHKAINREATKGDGDFFQENTLGKLY